MPVFQGHSVVFNLLFTWFFAILITPFREAAGTSEICVFSISCPDCLRDRLFLHFPRFFVILSSSFISEPKAILCHIISHVSCIFIASNLFNLIFLKHFTQNQFNSLHTDIRNFLCNILLRNWNNCSKQNTLNSFGFFAFLREISVNDSSKSLKHLYIICKKLIITGT